jgi:TCP-1/cpn60 chaperonin family
VALMRTLKPLDSLKSANDDQKVGINIVRRALQAPARQIAENAGEDGAVIAGKILDSSDYAFGYNAQTGEFGDLVKQGVIDPAKVVRTALQDAASVVGLLVTTEAMVAEKPKPKAPPAMPHGGGMGDGLLVASLESIQKATSERAVSFCEQTPEGAHSALAAAQNVEFFAPLRMPETAPLLVNLERIRFSRAAKHAEFFAPTNKPFPW